MKLVLWIEDSAFGENRILASPVNNSGNYDLIIATTATEAMALIQSESFDAVIVDIRIAPGSDPFWIDLVKAANGRKEAARLGLFILRSLLDDAIREDECPGWVDASRFGVLSVETWPELENDLTRLGIKAYRKKSGLANKRLLLDLIEEIITQ